MVKSRKPNRLAGYDYSQDGAYFFTSVVQDRHCCLGEVCEGVMNLNVYGKIAEERWFWLAEQYPYVRLHAFVVMPNHVHGILEIDRSMIGPQHLGTGRDLVVGTGRDLSLPPIKIKSLSELKGAYKTTVSKHIHLAGMPEFAWQRSFHDHIIRDESAFHRISQYILDNPARWMEDENYGAK